MNIYIGNFSAEVTEDDLKEAFATFGEVANATVIKDKFSGESRGFGFVEMPAKKEAEAAMEGIKELKGRMVTINEARPRTDNHHGGSGGGASRGRSSFRSKSSGYGKQRGGW